MEAGPAAAKRIAEIHGTGDNVVVITGSTGSGKTTMAKMIMKHVCEKHGLKPADDTTYGIETYFVENATIYPDTPDLPYVMEPDPFKWDDPAAYDLGSFLEDLKRHIALATGNLTSLRKEQRNEEGAFTYTPGETHPKPPLTVIVFPFPYHTMEFLKMDIPSQMIDCVIRMNPGQSHEVHTFAMRALRDLPRDFHFFMAVMMLNKIHNARDQFLLDLMIDRGLPVPIYEMLQPYKRKIVERRLQELRRQQQQNPDKPAYYEIHQISADLANYADLVPIPGGNFRIAKGGENDNPLCHLIIPGTDSYLDLPIKNKQGNPMNPELLELAWNTFLDLSINPFSDSRREQAQRIVEALLQ
ncbi:hypothetical protein GF357_03810 [Candidatus Dojkabacteria bacterium]|nr:hypothetical protein [Candidatus Dojkabacteria bacterium]